jgi:AbrB family looped-hinge helix DNA binding protein
MEATVAERGQITLPKAVRDALGLTKGTKLKVELDGGRIVLRKDVDDALSRACAAASSCRASPAPTRPCAPCAAARRATPTCRPRTSPT